MLRSIYMDANATTPALPAVVQAMHPHFAETFGNASAVHRYGRVARAAIDQARDQVASLIRAQTADLTFTGGGTESDNLALFGVLSPGDHLVLSSIEHDAVLQAGATLEQRGVEVTRVDCDSNGVVQPSAVAAALQPNTRLVTVMLANNETGAIQPVGEIASVAHAAGALMHTDAVQACGKIPVDVTELGCDLLSLSSHKMHGPQGVGALWVRPGVSLRSTQIGGPQERGRRAGTENVPGIVGMGAAAVCAIAWLADGGAQRLSAMRDTLEDTVVHEVSGTVINSKAAPRLPNTSSMRFEGTSAEALVIALDLLGLAVSGGSACQSGTIEPSHVLRAMHLSEQDARGSVRFSLSQCNTDDEVALGAWRVAAATQRLRSL